MNEQAQYMEMTERAAAAIAAALTPNASPAVLEEIEEGLYELGRYSAKACDGLYALLFHLGAMGQGVAP